jgi:hypothetical protein
MSVETESSAPRARTPTTAGLARLRRGSLAVLVLLVVEYAIESILVRHWGLIAASVIGLLAMIFASVAGTGFTRTGADSASMAMSVLTGIAMLCYAANLCLLGPGIRRG